VTQHDSVVKVHGLVNSYGRRKAVRGRPSEPAHTAGCCAICEEQELISQDRSDNGHRDYDERLVERVTPRTPRSRTADPDHQQTQRHRTDIR
jgi:hypothetical protein